MDHSEAGTIRAATSADAAAIVRIYNYYIQNTVATFEEETIAPGGMAARIDEVVNQALPWLVLEDDNRVLGYAYANEWRNRTAYRFSAEVTVYLAQGESGHGYGTRLYAQLLSRLKEHGMHTAVGVIALPNPASIALHERFGMFKVAHLKEMGWKFGQWLDVGYWQGLL
jgi:L-amino acid N-acyltransferase YncA